jgi:hypothetical protein
LSSPFLGCKLRRRGTTLLIGLQTMPIDFKARASLNKGYADKLSSGTLEDLIREFMRAESPRRREYTIVVGENVYHAAEVES